MPVAAAVADLSVPKGRGGVYRDGVAVRSVPCAVSLWACLSKDPQTSFAALA